MNNYDFEEKDSKFKITPTVAIVGRPNVGKSALFNAIIGKRVSIVHEESGVTRDSIIAPVKIQGNYLQLIDTGGLGTGKTKALKNTSFFDTKICSQVEVAIDSADVLLFVVDVTAGVTPLDEEVAGTLRKSGKKIILIVNKVDNNTLEENLSEFTRLSIDEILPVSCLHRRGIKQVSETFSKYIWKSEKPAEETRLAITVVGRPNVGKSSIINKLTGKDRLIVSDIAGTTRDAVDLPIDLNINDELIPASLVDTAGLRKKGKANSAVEIFSVMRAQDAIKRSDIVLLVIEADQYGPTAQDAHIGKIISDCGKGCIIIANKWDACSGLKQKEVTKEIRSTLPFLAYAPIVYSCALSGYNFNSIMNEIKIVNEQYKIKIPTSTVNKVLSDAMIYNPPTCVKSKFLKIFYATMVANKPPLFSLFVNDPKLCTKNYQAYLKNYLRKSFNLHGLPIHLKFKQRQSKRK
ncbi:MAG TPA: ribosome biogenesis GTPase Der [Victivallales bacterium]|nr:ribosome biogenesis GTPase Der [Victivallales bacterium]